MPYLKGDYYRGDYYRGDPGIFDFFKRAARGIAGAVGGFIGGGGIAGAVIGAGKGVLRGEQADVAAIQPGSSMIRRPNILPMQTGEEAELGLVGPSVLRARAAAGGMGGMAMRGMHANKSTYITRGGGTSKWPRTLVVHRKGTEVVKARRMNVTNPRALRRALRRIGGFGKLVKRSRRAIARAASAVGVHRAVRRKAPPRR